MFDVNQLLNAEEKQALLWLWDNRELLNQRYLDDDYLFDYPDYGGMPEPLFSVLSPELVDWVQEHTQVGFPSNQDNFLREVVKAQL